MILGIYGFQDSGKTTTVELLVKALSSKGYKVASVKHTPHYKSIDAEGKDTWRHWKAGSDPVVFSSVTETAIIKHSETPIDDIVRIVTLEYHPDVVVVEGIKEGSFPKVAIGNLKPTKNTVMRNPSLQQIVKYVETEVAVEKVIEKLPGLNCGKCGVDCEGLARAIVEGEMKLSDCVELASIDVEVFVGHDKIPMGRFASGIVNDTIRGMLSSLKGYKSGLDVEIRLHASRTKPRGRKL